MISINKPKVDKVDYIGTISMFQATNIPPGWVALTYNLELNPTTYPKLFNKIGYTFGTGIVNNTHFKPPSLFDSNGKFYHLKKTTTNGKVGVKMDATHGSHSHYATSDPSGSHGHTFPSIFFLGAGTNNRLKNANGSTNGSSAYGTPQAATLVHSGSHSHSFSTGSVSGRSTSYVQKILLKTISVVPCIYHGEI